MKKLSIMVISAVIILVCASTAYIAVKSIDDNSNNDDYYLNFKDSNGTEFTLNEQLKRIIVLNRQTSEAIKILGAENLVIATGDSTVTNNPYLGYENLPNVGNLNSLNYEAILELEPDAIFTKTNDTLDVEKMVGGAGIKVIRIDNYAPDTYKDEMILLGKILGKSDRAQKFLSYMDGLTDLVNNRLKNISDEDKPHVMALSIGALNSGTYRIFPCYSTDGTAGVGEGYSSILAGGKDASPEVKYGNTAGTAVLVDEEYVLDCGADVITLHGTWLGGYNCTNISDYKTVVDSIYSNTSISMTPAGQNKEVYVFHTDFLGAAKRPIGLLQLCKYLHPDMFSDIDVDSYAKEFFRDWIGTEYKGIWFYSAK